MKYESQIEWQRTHTRRHLLEFNANTDADILIQLDKVGNKQGYIKRLIREDIAKQKENNMDYTIKCYPANVTLFYNDSNGERCSMDIDSTPDDWSLYESEEEMTESLYESILTKTGYKNMECAKDVCSAIITRWNVMPWNVED